MTNSNRRILIIDENDSIWADLREMLAASAESSIRIDSSTHYDEGLDRVRRAIARNEPYAMTFVAVRRTGGTDALQTARKLLTADEALQIAICTPSESELDVEFLGEGSATGRVVLCRLPLDPAATRLLVSSLAEKWRLTRVANNHLQRQSRQITDARRVVTIIEGCLDEIESAHDELRGHALQLTQRLEQREIELLGTRDVTMFALAQLADSRDPETGEHLLRMRAYAQALAEHLATHGPYTAQITKQFRAEFYRSTPLHDIGKVGIPDSILLKPGALTEEEFEVMKRHTVIGAEALEKAASQSNFGGFLTMATRIARSHHEKFNGTGYPDGLCGRTIPLCARITALADVFDALTSARVYKRPMPMEEARSLIESEAGEHFDPAIVEAFGACYDEFFEIKTVIDGGADTPSAASITFEQSSPPLALTQPTA